MPPSELPLFTHWDTTLKDLLSRTRKFPKSVRHTFANRIEDLALDVVERLVEARWARSKAAILRAASLDVEKLRILCRLAHDEGFLDHRGYEHVARNLDEAGRMLGGWIKQQDAR
ncbi:MAG: diversity-generating retroelement protein Avd [Deltaproteobacteria bacterium]|nr:diversity-generating retroelement protein Avd [Deltaproteobacteria bacterium]